MIPDDGGEPLAAPGNYPGFNTRPDPPARVLDSRWVIAGRRKRRALRAMGYGTHILILRDAYPKLTRSWILLYFRLTVSRLLFTFAELGVLKFYRATKDSPRTEF
jgi:hypothetical protein